MKKIRLIPRTTPATKSIEALRVHEEFVERSAAASKAMQSAKTDEEMIQGMEALGFQYYEDEE